MRIRKWLMGLAMSGLAVAAMGAERKQREVMQAQFGANSQNQQVVLETVYIPPGEFWMRSTPEEKKWETGIEGGALPGTERESYEGEQPRRMRAADGFWMGRTEVTVGQFRRFVEESKYVTDAEKPGGKTQCFDPAWTSYRFTSEVTRPWKPMPGKSWRDPNFQFPLAKQRQLAQNRRARSIRNWLLGRSGPGFA